MESPREIKVSEVIKIVLESNDPALFFLYAKDCVGSVIFEHTINKVLRYGNDFDILLEEITNPQSQSSQPASKEPLKPANGIGTLKALVGKGENDEFTEADAKNVGKMIGTLTGTKKMELVGMMNFLGASCHIYNNIRSTFNNQTKKAVTSKNGEKLYSNIYRYLNRANESVNDFLYYNEDEIKLIREGVEAVSSINALSNKDMVKAAILMLMEMSDSQIMDAISLCETTYYTTDQHAAIRDKQNNGKGGLKALAGKSKGDYLEDTDGPIIANRIKAQKDEDQKRLYLGYVSLLGAMCPLHRAMKQAYQNYKRQELKKKLSTNGNTKPTSTTATTA